MEFRYNKEKVKALYFILTTFVELFIGICFIIGSVFFFYDSLAYYGTWLFLIGSVLMVIKPLIKFAREIHLYMIKSYDEIIKK